MLKFFLIFLVVGTRYATAWEVDGFRSGMTIQDVKNVIGMSGPPALMGPLGGSGLINFYRASSQDDSRTFIFCGGTLMEYQLERFTTPFERFVQFVDVEIEKRLKTTNGKDGRPLMDARYYEGVPQVSAIWTNGGDRLTARLEKSPDTTTHLVFNRIIEDIPAKMGCVTPPNTTQN